jgi:hypothetical protein
MPPPTIPRERICLRLSTARLAEVDTIAESRECTRSDALRYLLGLGLTAHRKANPSVTTTPKPSQR